MKLDSLELPMKERTLEGFGDRLAEMRQTRGMTQAELAQAVGVSRRVTAYYEHENAQPPGAVLVDLAKVLHGSGGFLTSPEVITNYTGANSITSPSQSAFRDNGKPTPSHVFWGPKIHANLFGNGIGAGGSASAGIENGTTIAYTYGMGFEIPRLRDTHLDNAGAGLAAEVGIHYVVIGMSGQGLQVAGPFRLALPATTVRWSVASRSRSVAESPSWPAFCSRAASSCCVAAHRMRPRQPRNSAAAPSSAPCTQVSTWVSMTLGKYGRCP